MDLCAQEVAAVRAAAGLRSGLRRHPVRAQAVRDPRHATLAPLRAQVAKTPPYLTDPPRAKAQGAVHKLVASAKHLRIAAWVELTVEERALPLTLKEDAQSEAAKRAGGSGLKTDLTPPQANKESVHDRDPDLASVAQALRTCTTAPLAGRPIFLRREARPRAHAFVVMLASLMSQ